MEKMKLIDVRRKETYDNLVDVLKTWHKCMVVRPMSFGKTFMLVKLMSNYKKVLYLYPTNIIKDVVITRYAEQTNNVEFMSYYALATTDVADMKQYDLIIADECHRLGAENTKVKLKQLLAIQDCVFDFVGATGTPDRMDSFNVAFEFFDNHTVYEYTLHDAFSDGVMEKPLYCYMSYDYTLDIERSMQGCDRKEIDAKIIEAARLYRADRVIHNELTKAYPDRNYFKFICFYSTIDILLKKHKEMLAYFKSAFPNMKVKELIIVSRGEYRNNLKELDSLVKTPGEIHLIMCVDMLNMGYHVDDITGVCLYRGTSSSIIFLQQLGRCLSSDSSEQKIIFDFVDAINRPAIFQLLDKKVRNANGDTDIDNVSERYYNINEVDLIASGHMASYSKFIQKCCEEPFKSRCRRGYELWVNAGGRDPRREVPLEFWAMAVGVSSDDIKRVINNESMFTKLSVEDYLKSVKG